MKTGKSTKKQRRVAISLELDWGYKHHLSTFAGCQRYAEEAGWHCTIDPAPHRLLNRKSGKIPYDGVLARATPELATAAKRKGVPVVNVWMNSPVTDLPSVLPDKAMAGQMAAEHLMARGFRQFGYLGYLRDIACRLEQGGFRERLKMEKFTCTSHRIVRTKLEGNAPGWERFVVALEEWIDELETPIGIFVTHDLICRYLIDVCRSKGIHVSQDVAIVGTGNEPSFCNAPPPTLTSIEEGYEQIGYRASALLDGLMSGRSQPTEPELVPPAELVPRQSTDSYAADDPMVARAMRFIAENGQERIEVKHVVSAVATNRRTLERKFRDSMGRSIAGEITRLRIERAKRRLVETDLPLKTVAKDSGFRNADHFYKVFARVMGVPPTDYRDERQRVFLEQEEQG